MSSPLILPKKGLRRELYKKRSFILITSKAKLKEKKEKETWHTVFHDFDHLPDIQLKKK